MRTIYLWRGYHGPEWRDLFDRCWHNGDLLIACPPTDIDPSFAAALPDGHIRLVGAWPESFAKHLDERSRPVACSTLYPEPPILGVFTTGTSRSAQKLVLYSRTNIIASQDAIFDLYDASRIDTIFCYPQPYHVFGLLLGYALARRKGLQLVYPDGMYSRTAHDLWLAQRSANMLTLATPSHLLDLAAHIKTTHAQPRPTYSCILGGAKVDRATWHVARDVANIVAPSIGYGCTEASPGITHLPPGVEPIADGDIGWPLAHVTLNFSIEQSGGGYTIQGPGVCLATIEDGQLDFPNQHAVHDELQMLEGGRLAFVHRTDMVLNRGGEKFPLERIEAVLKSTLGVNAICVAVPDTRLGFELGIVAAAADHVPTERLYDTLNDVFRRRFNHAHLRRVDEVPLNSNAKPDRKAAAALLSLAANPL